MIAYPDVFLFNPTCEMAIANGTSSYMPPKRLQQFESDLSVIPLFLADPEDMVIVTEYPGDKFLETMQRAGVSVPRFVSLKEVMQMAEKQFGALRPWGWSPQVHRILSPLKPFCHPSFRNSPVAQWRSEHKWFFGRWASVKLVETIFESTLHTDCIEIPALPVEINALAQWMEVQSRFNGEVVLKSPWSSSGRGVLMVHKNQQVDERWISAVIRQQGCVFAEPYLEALQDVSFHFYLHENGELSYLGHNFFSTDPKGRFKGCFLEEYPGSLPKLPLDAIQEARELIQKGLLEMNLASYYSGPLGVDGLFFRKNNGAIKLHPAIELNMRHTMGLVNIRMRQVLHSEARGIWCIEQFKPGAKVDFYNYKSTTEPIVCAEGKAISGFLPLTSDKGLFGAWMQLRT